MNLYSFISISILLFDCSTCGFIVNVPIGKNLPAATLNNVKHESSLSALPFDVVADMYNQALYTNPLETKLATGGILAIAGDAIAQSREVGGYDTKRASAFVTFDVLYRAFQCASFPEITRVCDGNHLGALLPNIDVNILATVEQTMGKYIG